MHSHWFYHVEPILGKENLVPSAVAGTSNQYNFRLQGSWARESGALMSKPGQLIFLTYFILVASICWGLLARMFKEDEALHREFGEAWESWARAVPYKLLPGIY